MSYDTPIIKVLTELCSEESEAMTELPTSFLQAMLKRSKQTNETANVNLVYILHDKSNIFPSFPLRAFFYTSKKWGKTRNPINFCPCFFSIGD